MKVLQGFQNRYHFLRVYIGFCLSLDQGIKNE
jgi:hypothetical protein